MKTVIARDILDDDDNDMKVPIYLWGEEGIEFGAVEQVRNIARLPFVHHHVALMPDAHFGIGACVGSVVPTLGAIIPAAVGVDIGCGMVAAKLDILDGELDYLPKIRAEIEKRIPHGRTNNGGPGDRGAWGDVPDTVAAAWEGYLSDDYVALLEHTPELKPKTCPVNQLGTLGTGNHFVEVCVDERGNVWIVLHSGSRGIGNRIGTYWIEKAREDMRAWFINLPDKDLAYIPEGTQHFLGYTDGVRWAQKFAKESRSLMLAAAIEGLEAGIGKKVRAVNAVVDCHHNYVERENHFGKNVWLTRKGAIRARTGDVGIIPGSMGKGSYIVEGLGNFESFNSASHGAGRRLGRNEAKRLYSVADLKDQTQGVECRKDADVIDEIPSAYKNLDNVMEAQKDLVKIKHKLVTIVCCKG